MTNKESKIAWLESIIEAYEKVIDISSEEREKALNDVSNLQNSLRAYQRVFSLSEKELKEAKDIIKAQEKNGELARKEMIHLRERAFGIYEDIGEHSQSQIVAIMGEDTQNEQYIIDQLESLAKTKQKNFFSDLFMVLVNYQFTEEEAHIHWEKILEHKKEFSEKVGRAVGFRVALLDYFIVQNKLLKNPKIIEISLFEEVLKTSLLDELTRVYNRRYLNLCLPREIKRAQRRKRTLSVLLFDIDDFKQFNDKFGHIEGDEVLRKIGETLHDVFRSEDTPCRFGGEEFLVILPESNAKSALKVTNRLRKQLAKIKFKGKWQLKISGGIAEFAVHAADSGSMILAADRALYKAKLQGKDRVLIAQETK